MTLCLHACHTGTCLVIDVDITGHAPVQALAIRSKLLLLLK